MREILRSLPLTICVSMMAAQAGAAVVELRSSDGLLSIEGELQGFDGKMLTVRTVSGDVTIPASDMTCIGATCPPELVGDTSQKAVVVTFEGDAARNRFLAALTGDGLEAKSGLSVEQSAADTLSVDGLGENVVELALKDPGTRHKDALRVTMESLGDKSATRFTGPNDWAGATGYTSFHIGTEVFAAVVSPSLSIDPLSVADLAAIYSGEARNWSAFGGPDIEIQPVRVKAGTVANTALQSAVLNAAGAGFDDKTLTVHDEAQAVSLLPIAQGAIAFVGLDAVGDSKVVPILGSCATPVQPDGFSIASGTYPLTLSTIVSGDTAALTNAGRTIFDATAYAASYGNAARFDGQMVKASPELRSARIEGLLSTAYPEALREPARRLVQTLIGSERLSITLQDGSATQAVAAKGRADFVRLAEAIQDGQFDGQEVQFIGFAAEDATNPKDSLQRSLEAADRLLAAFREFAPQAATRNRVRFSAAGYGSVGIQNCDPSSVGGRVEIWTRAAE